MYFKGGFDGQNFLSDVEIYDPAIDVWQDGEPLTSGRSGHASAVCYQPPCSQTCQILSNLSGNPCSSKKQ